MKGQTRPVLVSVMMGIATYGCGDASLPMGPEVRHAFMQPALRSDDACYGVSGTMVESFQGADLPNGIFYFGGPVTGDLVGTSLSGLTASTKPAGDPPSPVGFGAGTSTISVTGGAIADLHGASLVFELEQVARTNFPAVSFNQTMTLVSGARRGHLTVHGVFDFSTFTSTTRYRGSICP